MVNKFDWIRVPTIEPNCYLYNTLARQTPLCRNRKNASLNGHKHQFVYFIDDLNCKYSCNSAQSDGSEVRRWRNEKNLAGPSFSVELARQILETKSIYAYEQESFVPLSEINLMFSCAYPG